MCSWICVGYTHVLYLFVICCLQVSKYCSLNLPGFIKKLSSYQAGDCKEALIDAFVKFDQTLTRPDVVEALKQLAQVGSAKLHVVSFADDAPGEAEKIDR